MDYYVYNGKYQKVYISDEILEESHKQNGAEYGIEIINAMMESRNPKHLNKLIESLHHEKLQNRVSATFAIVSLNIQSAIPALKNAISMLDESDYQNQISIKAITEAAIILLDGGVSKVKQLFFNDAKFPTLVKELFLSCYSSSRISFTHADIEFLVDATRPTLKKEASHFS